MRKKTSEGEHKKKSCENPEKGKQWLRADGRPSRLLNKFAFIKDSSKSMRCCELLFMTKALVDAG